MKSFTDLPDGARIVHHGPGHGPAVLFMGRSNLGAAAASAAGVKNLFQDCGLAFLTYEPPFAAANLRIDPGQRLDRLPAIPRRALRGLLFLLRPTLWKFLLPEVRRRSDSVSYCARSMARAVGALPRPPLLLAGHSRGAWVMSLMADRLGAAGLVCFGYPFRHPNEPEDSARTAHLAQLRTPCLILQGTRDPYGGAEIAGRYRFSAATRLEFIEAGHDLAMSEAQWREMSVRIARFAGQVLPPAVFSAGSAASR